jgi:hypothetical protein
MYQQLQESEDNMQNCKPPSFSRCTGQQKDRITLRAIMNTVNAEACEGKFTGMSVIMSEQASLSREF